MSPTFGTILHYDGNAHRLGGLEEHTPPVHFTTAYWISQFPPRPQMKEESPYALNRLRPALRIYNKRRIIDLTVRLNRN